MERLGEYVYVNRIEAQGYSITSGLVLTPTRAFVFDTSINPQAMAPVLEMISEAEGQRRIVVINSHHHWDHVYGNMAFAGRDIVAHRTCLRLMISQGRSSDDKIPLQPTEGVAFPTVSFGDRLTYIDEVETVHLIHTPGHSEDSIIMYLDKARVLLAGDTVEWPIPSLTMRDGKDSYIRTLRQLKQLPVDTVVPTHGPWMGKAIIDANERYILTMYDAVKEAKDRGVTRHKLDLPAEAFASEGVTIDDVYRRQHAENLHLAYDEV